jgi:ABC-2 type transport system permease protein
MAVHKRAYRPYDGPLTSERWRFLVLPRYAFSELFQSRLLMAYVVLCFVPFLIEAAGVYVAHSAAARLVLGLPDVASARMLRSEFFLGALSVQGFLAFFLAAWVAPVLVSPDLVNGALPLYLSRPFTRGEYILGKMTVLVVLLSLVTWVPLMAVFFLQAGLADGWLTKNLRVGSGLFVGSLVWVGLLTVLGLAVSACIRWRIVATGAMFAIFFMGAAFGEMWREVLRNPWGRLANITYLLNVVWRDLFGIVETRGGRRGLVELPPWAAWAGLLAICLVCLWLLHKRLRAREVVA